MSWERKLVPSSRTYLCSMQGIMCKIRIVGGRSPSSKGLSSCKGYEKGLSWLGLRQARAAWLMTLKQGAGINLNKASKTYEM